MCIPSTPLPKDYYRLPADGLHATSAGQVGPKSSFLKDPKSPELASAGTLGAALFGNETFDQWSNLFSINISAVFFVTTAFLGLLDNASKADEPFSASVINITSISGSTKVAQAHVSPEKQRLT